MFQNPTSYFAQLTSVVRGLYGQVAWIAATERPIMLANQPPTYWQLSNLKEFIPVLQLKLPIEGRYSLVYQKVQSSVGSTDSEL